MYLTHNKYFSQASKIDILNGLIFKFDTLSPTQLVSATGCSYSDALYILVLLYYMDYAKAYLKFYDRDKADLPLMTRSFEQGFPTLPVRYEQDDQIRIIESKDDLLLRFEFKILDKDIEFQIGKNDSNDSS